MTRSTPAIRLTLPGLLRYRNVAVRALAAACELVGADDTADAVGAAPAVSAGMQLANRFDAELVSAVSEIFNNIVIHGYGSRGTGEIELLMKPTTDRMTVRITDNGTSFDISRVPTPELETLPEGGMGLHIARSCVDRLDYQPGPPNVWHLVKVAAHSQEKAVDSR
jgi:anti-sigma regulatory factor (Ser/Thr protein kinase)